MIPVKTKALGSPEGFSGTPKHAQDSTLGLFYKGIGLEAVLGVLGAVKRPIIAEGCLEMTYNKETVALACKQIAAAEATFNDSSPPG